MKLQLFCSPNSGGGLRRRQPSVPYIAAMPIRPLLWIGNVLVYLTPQAANFDFAFPETQQPPLKPPPAPETVTDSESALRPDRNYPQAQQAPARLRSAQPTANGEGYLAAQTIKNLDATGDPYLDACFRIEFLEFEEPRSHWIRPKPMRLPKPVMRDGSRKACALLRRCDTSDPTHFSLTFGSHSFTANSSALMRRGMPS